MFLFKRKKKEIAHDKKEEAIQSVRSETMSAIEKTTVKMRKLNNLLDDKVLGVTGMIFYATGGDRRNGKH